MKLKRFDVFFLTVLAVLFLAGAMASVSLGEAHWLVGVTALLVLVNICIQIGIYRITGPHITAQFENYRQIESLFSLFATVKVGRALPSMRGWAISPDFANILVTTIRDVKPECIVEAGSGVSTILSGYCLKELGRGKVHSLDHDPTYWKITQSALRVHGLEGIARIVDAPVRSLVIHGREHVWYDTARLGELPAIDLLVVDGPPEILHELARYPALPVLYQKLSPGAVVLVDDASDPCMRRIVDLWLQEYPEFTREWIDTEKGTVILRRG